MVYAPQSFICAANGKNYTVNLPYLRFYERALKPDLISSTDYPGPV
jgi:hypothetical protein